MTALECDASLGPSRTDSATVTVVSSDIAGHSKWTQWKTWKIFQAHCYMQVQWNPNSVFLHFVRSQL
jgi:hypothetical protein